MMPGAENRPLPPATTPKKMNTRRVPATRAELGAGHQPLRTSGVCAIRSSRVRFWSQPRQPP